VRLNIYRNGRDCVNSNYDLWKDVKEWILIHVGYI
jgi:hypothetical protein